MIHIKEAVIIITRMDLNNLKIVLSPAEEILRDLQAQTVSGMKPSDFDFDFTLIYTYDTP